jgi:predicted PurR-regulated permease PerM
MLILAAAALVLIFYFLFPFLDGLILGTVFAYVGRPIMDKFMGRRRLGALVATSLIVVPIFLILGLGMLEIANQIIALAHNQESLRIALHGFMERRELAIPPAAIDIITSGLQNVAGVLAPIVASIPVLQIGRTVSLWIINFIISIPVCYFVMVDGKSFVESAMVFLPGPEVETFRKYLARIDAILSGIFIGTIYTSILGSIIAAAIFYAFGLPRPFALASIVFIAGMVPILTAWVVIVPVALYRYLTLGTSEALIFLVASSALIYLPSELLIRPYLVSSRSSMHPLLVMLSFFGGALVAGIGGFFLAPAIMGIIVAIYQVRREEMDSRVSSACETSDESDRCKG